MPPDLEYRWSHCTNWLGSHAADPDDDQWTDPVTGLQCTICNNCNYYVWLCPDWQRWRT